MCHNRRSEVLQRSVNVPKQTFFRKKRKWCLPHPNPMWLPYVLFSIPDHFSSPYLWLYCSLFPESPFFICECLNPTQCLLQMPYPPKYFPDFPDGTISPVSKLLSLYLIQCLFVHDPKFFRCTGTNTGLCSHLSPAPASSPPLPSQPFNSCHQFGCRIQTHCSAPLWHETLVRQASPRGWGCLVRKHL